MQSIVLYQIADENFGSCKCSFEYFLIVVCNSVNDNHNDAGDAQNNEQVLKNISHDFEHNEQYKNKITKEAKLCHQLNDFDLDRKDAEYGGNNFIDSQG